MIEYTLHARAISRFLAENYPAPRVLAEWEAALWGDKGTSTPSPMARFHPADLARFRSAVSVLVTVVPTAALTYLSGIVLSEISDWTKLCMSVAVIVSLLYIVSAVAAWSYIWPSKGH
jgi:hypothetical protein